MYEIQTFFHTRFIHLIFPFYLLGAYILTFYLLVKLGHTFWQKYFFYKSLTSCVCPLTAKDTVWNTKIHALISLYMCNSLQCGWYGWARPAHLVLNGASLETRFTERNIYFSKGTTATQSAFTDPVMCHELSTHIENCIFLKGFLKYICIHR